MKEMFIAAAILWGPILGIGFQIWTGGKDAAQFWLVVAAISLMILGPAAVFAYLARIYS